MDNPIAMDNLDSLDKLEEPPFSKFSGKVALAAETRQVTVRVVLDVNIVSPLPGRALRNTWMIAEDVVDSDFTDNWLGIFIAFAARCFPNCFAVHEVHFGEYAN